MPRHKTNRRKLRQKEEKRQRLLSFMLGLALGTTSLAGAKDYLEKIVNGLSAIRDGKIYNDKAFRNVFGVPKSVFRILVELLSPYITCGADAVGLPGMSLELKFLTTLRLMRTGLVCVQLDDQVSFAPETIRLGYRQVIQAIVGRLREKYVS